MGLFGNLFDFNGDGESDAFETFVGMQMIAGSRKESLEMTGDDTFYLGDDEEEDEE